MEIELKIAALGIIGTLLGTIIGWMLNNLTRLGKLNIHILKWAEDFQYNNAGYLEQSTSIESTEYYNYTFEIEIYNSSADTKIMRNIFISFMNEKRCIKKNVPHDNALTIYRHPINTYFDVEPINIPPKTVIRYKLTNGFNNQGGGLSFLWETTRIELQYTDEKNKTQQVLIKQQDYNKYFDNFLQEDTLND